MGLGAAAGSLAIGASWETVEQALRAMAASAVETRRVIFWIPRSAVGWGIQLQVSPAARTAGGAHCCTKFRRRWPGPATAHPPGAPLITPRRPLVRTAVLHGSSRSQEGPAMCRATPHLAVAVAIAVAVAAALSAGCAGQSGSAGPAGPARPRITFIRGARVFDGEKLLGPTNVVLRDGLIAAMGEAADQTVAPPGADVVDGRDRTLLPGLIDAHTHIWNAAQLRQAAALGVTTELDLMSDWKLMATLKAKAKEDPSMADLRSAGNPATSPKGHGTEYGLPIATLARPEQAEAFVVERLKEGSDYLKIVYEPGREQMTSLDRAT